MNKYARIDKVVTKGSVYCMLFQYHNMTPGQIAARFGVQIDSVVRAIAKARYKGTSEMSSNSVYLRAWQIAWTYVY